MPYTPQQFATLLRESSLTREDEDAVIGLLPHLTMKQIEKLGKVFEKDVKDTDKVFQKAQLKGETIQLKMVIELTRQIEGKES